VVTGKIRLDSMKSDQHVLPETGRKGLCLAAAAAPGINLPSLEDLNFIFLNNFFILVTVFIFFAGVLLFYRFKKQTIPPERVKTTLKFALFGFFLLFLDFGLKDVPHYGAILTALGGLVVLFCLANLVIFLIVDVYLYVHVGKKAPSFVRELISLAVYLSFAIVSLRLIFRIEISSIITTTTVLTAAIAFAMQNTLGNILAGFAIQSDRLLRLKTWVGLEEKGVFGQIHNIGFRYTTLRSLDNNYVLVPNSTLIQNTVTSFGSREDDNKVAVILTVSLGYDLPPEKAKGLLLRVLTDETGILANPAPLVRLRSFADSSIDYQLKFFLDDYSNRDTMTDRVFSRTWYAVTRAGYSFPFPHRQVIATRAAEPFDFSAEIVVAGMRRVELLSVLDETELADLAEKTRIRVYGPGEIVVRQNEEGHSLFIVLKGSLHALVNEIRVGEILEGSFFGEMSLLTGEARKATVVADSETTLAELSREVIEPFIRRKPEIMDSLSSILARRELINETSLREMERAIAEVNKSAEYLQRLKRFFKL
jgi:small-conductance mechanosensitive channel/CRP-like cAMP-binding protein